MCTLSTMRNAHLLQAARAELRLHPRWTMRRAVAAVLTRPVAQGYYVGMDHALAMLRAMRSGGGLPPGMSPLRRLMWQEIEAKVTERQRLTGCNTTDATAHVLGGATASRFFLSPATAMRIVYTA